VEAIPNINTKLRRVWLLLAFIVRAFILPDDFFENICLNVDLKCLQKEFYILYEQLFGTSNCTYNIHCFFHIHSVRTLGPLTYSSAFLFESFFSFLKRDYQVGTMSPGKQGMLKSYQRILLSHSCEKKIKFSFVRKQKTDDSVVYLKLKGFFRIIGVGEDITKFSVRKLILDNADNTLHANGLIFSYVGVYLLKGEESKNEQIH
jgi:hypothetical protein